MTKNTLAAMELARQREADRETQRANKAREAENERANREREIENFRSNRANEAQRRRDSWETQRHNLASEAQARNVTMEQHRANLAQEQIANRNTSLKWGELAESERSHRAQEANVRDANFNTRYSISSGNTLRLSELNESRRTHKMNELLQQTMQTETHRANLVNEQIRKKGNEISFLNYGLNREAQNIRRLELGETMRHNQASESLQGAQIAVRGLTSLVQSATGLMKGRK